MKDEVARGELTQETIGMLCELRGEPALSTEEVAEIACLSEICARDKLEALEGSGEVSSKQLPEGEQVWWLESQEA